MIPTAAVTVVVTVAKTVVVTAAVTEVVTVKVTEAKVTATVTAAKVRQNIVVYRKTAKRVGCAILMTAPMDFAKIVLFFKRSMTVNNRAYQKQVPKNASRNV